MSSDTQIYEIWRDPVLRIAVVAGRSWRADRKSLRARDDLGRASGVARVSSACGFRRDDAHQSD